MIAQYFWCHEASIGLLKHRSMQKTNMLLCNENVNIVLFRQKNVALILSLWGMYSLIHIGNILQKSLTVLTAQNYKFVNTDLPFCLPLKLKSQNKYIKNHVFFYIFWTKLKTFFIFWRDSLQMKGYVFWGQKKILNMFATNQCTLYIYIFAKKT